MENLNENAEQGNWIKISRKILNWEWYSETNTFRVFVDLLLNAQYKDTRYRGNLIKRGQLITSVNAISERTGLSARNIRTALEHLQNTKEIDKQTDKHFTLITICKYDTYQDKSEESDKQTDNPLTNNRQTTDNIQEIKNNKKEKEIKSDNAHTRMHNGFSLEEALTKITEETKIRYEKIETVFCAIKDAYTKVMENNFMNKEGNCVTEDSFVKFVLRRVIPGCTEMEKRLLRTEFSFGDVIKEINSHWSEKNPITEGNELHSYLKGMYEKRKGNGFVKKDGTKYTLSEITSLFEEKLTDVATTHFRIDLDAPFRYYSLIMELKDEQPLVKWYVVEKYRRFRASGFKTNKGSVTDLSFFRKMLPEFKKEIKEKFKFENII